MKVKNVLGLLLLVGVSLAFVNCANQNKKHSLRRIHFDYDQSFVRSDMVSIMDGNVGYLKGGKRSGSKRNLNQKHGQQTKGSSKDVTIEGHCDERGTNEYNYALGARRAEATKSYLVSHGVEPSRVKTVSYGEDRPLKQGHDESAWYYNRRAEFMVGR